MLIRRRLISIDVTKGSFSQIVTAIMELAVKRESSYVCVANVHMLLESHYSSAFKDVVNGANIVTADGMPLAKSFKLLYGEQQERVDGMNLLPALLKESVTSSSSVFFYGGKQGMLETTEKYLKETYPDLIVAGTYSPPFRELTDEEYIDTAKMITASGANIVFVVLGCPKQEIWMAKMKGKIPAVMIGIGGALPVMVGLQLRAPNWMQRNSLEWSFRLMQEPRRLFKRYFKTNSHFIYLITKERFKRRNDSINNKKETLGNTFNPADPT